MANPLFSITNLSKTFPKGNQGLVNINLTIFEGECLLIAGSNGSGKTLLVRILTGLAEPTSGTVLFQGFPLQKSTGLLRRSVGLVFQNPDAQIVGETVTEDIAFGPKNLGLSKDEIESQVEAALHAAGLAEKRDFLPRQLSGGEKRRLAVAGILAMGCKTVIMDEPFANLDWSGVIQVLEIIKGLKTQGRTLIILTHELEKVLAFADRLIILHKGLIRDQGKPVEVLNRLDPSYGVRDPRKQYAAVEDCTWLTE
ncbi:MAG: energy-coupling factor ABC transporter ATP-binding protein [Treponema sp.]|jgi:biotin transport system ATP-binding protein|nr:energy-coupling factor ABC transporter ATP-binding protein [Treponema sp.]